MQDLKSRVFDALLNDLRAEVKLSLAASKDAADYATNDEAKAVSQWDTQGLEASYLAAGQASQAKQWADAIEELQSEREELLRPNETISLGALFSCTFLDEIEYFFFTGVAGGQTISLDDFIVTVVTPQSPLAMRLLGKKVGDVFVLPNGNEGSIQEIF